MGSLVGSELDVRNEPRPDVQTRLEQVAVRLDARLDVLDLKLDRILALLKPVADGR